MRMRMLVLGAALLLAPLVAPAQPAAACPAPSIPLYPGASPSGPPGPASVPVMAGHIDIPSTASLLDVQRYYYMILPNQGWQQAEQLPGQYIEQHSTTGYTPMDVPQGVLEFTRDNGRESVRIVGDGGGYSLYVSCRD